MMKDAEFVLAQLQQGPRTTMELIDASREERGFGLTPHSRVAELRKQGHSIRCDRVSSYRGRPVYQYRLLVEPEQLQIPA
jgi:hypothetical protein